MIGLFYHTWWYQLKQHSRLSDSQIIQLLHDSLRTPVKKQSDHKNILILGTDAIANRDGDPVLTDTIMLLSIDLKNGELKALSLPRDLWSEEYQTKINSLYEYGKEKTPEKPEQFPTEVIQELTNVPIHHTIVLSLDQLKELIDILAGVSVEITEGFVDDQFPRTEVNIRTERDPAKLYERVEFKTGSELMSGDRALKYVRSRHSSQLTQGTDNARSLRQQQIINAILKKARDSGTIKNPVTLGKIYDWYIRHFSKEISTEELITIIRILKQKVLTLSLEPQLLSFEQGNQKGVITHPPESKYRQWVYEVKNREEFQKEISQKLGL